jgi:hypothetical protein
LFQRWKGAKLPSSLAATGAFAGDEHETSELAVLAGMALGLCVSAVPARAETEADIPRLYNDDVLALPAAVFNSLSDMPIARADVGLIWVEVNKSNFESIVRRMADAKIPDELAGGSFEVIWHPDCRFSIDAHIVVPRLGSGSDFSDEEMLVARKVIAMVIQHEMISATTRTAMIRDTHCRTRKLHRSIIYF